MSRLQRIEARLAEVEETQPKPKDKKIFGFRAKALMKKSTKKKDYVLVQYLSQKYQMSFKLCKIISGNVIVVDNKVHELNPKATWRYGKHLWYIIREIDRKPVSNEDMDRLRALHRDTDEDVPLLKAVLGAVHKPGTISADKKKWIGIGIGILIAIGILYIFFK